MEMIAITTCCLEKVDAVYCYEQYEYAECPKCKGQSMVDFVDPCPECGEKPAPDGIICTTCYAEAMKEIHDDEVHHQNEQQTQGWVAD